LVEIPGGNHSQAGSCGLRPGDCEAQIKAEEEWLNSFVVLQSKDNSDFLPALQTNSNLQGR
jgi:hypothetical protein